MTDEQLKEIREYENSLISDLQKIDFQLDCIPESEDEMLNDFEKMRAGTYGQLYATQKIIKMLTQ